MKTTVFYLKYPKNPPDRWEHFEITFKVPTLPAYAIEFAEFYSTDEIEETQKEYVEGVDFLIQGQDLVWKNFKEPLWADNAFYRLKIHYHGIRDFSLLFPHINDAELKQRLGCFYEEAEIAFENKSWLGFSLMCGAIYEGLLYDLFKNKDSFYVLIEKAFQKEIVDEDTKIIMHTSRELRNLVHGNKYKEPYVTRTQAMDMRTIMDKLIKRDWEN